VSTYFQRLAATTPTRVWVNNPTDEEVGLALAQGAVGSTTNPAYGGNLLRRAPHLIEPLINAARQGTSDVDRAVELVQLNLVHSIAERFRALHDQSEGKLGYVSCQGSPERDSDAAEIIREAHDARLQGPNVAPKIPATPAGLDALEVLVAEGCPTIVTEVFSLDQLIEANERYLAVTSSSGARPPFFISPITGIFGDHLKVVATTAGIDVAPNEIEMIGVLLMRACYAMSLERGYPALLLAGGARIPFDLTGLVGARVHATINWATFSEILSQDPPPTASYADLIDPRIEETLKRAFPDVRAALAPSGLSLSEFEDFGPVQFFRSSFVRGWQQVREAVAGGVSAPAAAG